MGAPSCESSQYPVSPPSTKSDLSKAGLLTRLTYLELNNDTNLDLDSIPVEDLAVLFPITEEIELIGVDLPYNFWRDLARRSKRSDWAVKSLSIEKMSEMTGLYEGTSRLNLAEVISQTEEVWLSEIDSKFTPGSLHIDYPEKKCKMLEFWFDSPANTTGFVRTAWN